MKNLQLSLKRKWFEMTKSGEKKEDYREINSYWISRLISKDFSFDCQEAGIVDLDRIYMHLSACPNWFFKKFDTNIMTLGYPKSADVDRILRLEHKGIRIGYGKQEWGAEPNKLYFIIKHGKIIEK